MIAAATAAANRLPALCLSHELKKPKAHLPEDSNME
jgi:hypothetical protein